MIEIILVIICYVIGSCILHTINENISQGEIHEALNQGVDLLENDYVQKDTFEYQSDNNQSNEIIITLKRLMHYRTLKSEGLHLDQCEKYFASEQGKADQQAVESYIKMLQAFSSEQQDNE